MESIQEQFTIDLQNVQTKEDLKNIWDAYFGSKGSLSGQLKTLKDLDEEERRIQGPKIQGIVAKAKEDFKKTENNVLQKDHSGNLKKQAEDLDIRKTKIGHLHPLTETINMLNKFFQGLGYSIMEGPEIEEDEYCFKRLNVPPDHPARDMQDTLYVDEPTYLLRTQTSSIEARVLSTFKPPFKFVSPGRVYRNEKLNKSNHFMFHHYQGVVVLEQTNLKDLFGTFTGLFKTMYGPDVVTRFRNKYYPEVEPGVGPDMQCFSCKGKGCTLCKGVGWIEMGGAGMIHPNVMEMAGLDTKKWKGFAFGLGLDRWAMAKYHITDIRTLCGGNLGYKYYDHESII